MDNKAVIGRLGEDIARRFLLKKGYEILGMNYRKFHGEIDIIAQDLKEIVFVEVKTVTRESGGGVTRETYRPEFNVDEHKLRMVSKTGELFLLEKKLKNDWRVDLLAVELETGPKKATVRHLKAINL